MRGISRIDSKGTHGWFVRVYRDGAVHSRFFSDGKYGDQRAAFTVARQYRDEYERKHPPSLLARRFRLTPPSNNTSGIVGVSETFGRSRTGEIMPCFSVSWHPQPNLARTKPFYFSKYGGRDAALEAAIEFRKEREEEIRQSLVRGRSVRNERGHG